MFTCEEVLNELSNFLDGEITRKLLDEIQEHLRGCRKCSMLMNTTRKTVTLICGHYVSELPQGISERLVQRLGVR